MDSVTATASKARSPFGPLICEGKTKRIYEVTDRPRLVLIVSKDDITAGDGAKHDLIPGKAEWATETTCNVFRFLKSMGIPAAFTDRHKKNSFYAPKCEMLPYEIVIRREAHGSYLQRNPNIEKGYRFATPILEVYLKTKGRTWKEEPLPCDDPLLQFSLPAQIRLHDPHIPFDENKPFMVLQESEVYTQPNERDMFARMAEIAFRTFENLEYAWKTQGGRLVDFKVEFGIGPDGQLLLADVIDNDSWRVVKDGAYIDKQVYRDGGELDEVASKYASVAEITKRFKRPRT